MKEAFDILGVGSNVGNDVMIHWGVPDTVAEFSKSIYINQKEKPPLKKRSLGKEKGKFTTSGVQKNPSGKKVPL